MTVPVGTSDCEYVEVGDCPALLDVTVLNVLLADVDNTALLLCADVSETMPRNAVRVFIVRLVMMSLVFTTMNLHVDGA
jgi:hypothetical protein